jgi:elongator complex protein 4
MSFRKRNVVVAQPGDSTGGKVESETAPTSGVRPSPLDGRLTISTGTRSLDALLAGHAGLALGTSVLIEESGTTDFGGALLRYYAAEGVVQGHSVLVLGMHEAWARELPGLSGGERSVKKEETRPSEDRMKIAWRYERLGEFGGSRGVNSFAFVHRPYVQNSLYSPNSIPGLIILADRSIPQSSGSSSASQAQSIFCHDFDLTKRLVLPSSGQMQFVPTSLQPNLDFTTDAKPVPSPFVKFIAHLASELSSSPTSIHRLIIPGLLSPAFYPPEASKPENVLQFLHALRALLRKYPGRLTAMITLPLTLYPRTTGLTRWMELLSDGVLELAPFPSTAIATKAAPGASTMHEEPPQGMLKIHRLPVFHEKGGGGGESSGFGDDLAFTLSRRKGLVIKPFSLPPVEGDSDGQGGLEGEEDRGKATKVDIEF